MVPLLQLRHVTHFYGKSCALRGVDLAIEPGAIGLVGQNGAGKSTLMQILLGLIRPTHGSATVFGQDVRSGGGLGCEAESALCRNAIRSYSA